MELREFTIYVVTEEQEYKCFGLVGVDDFSDEFVSV
jgi:hypothetical protein